MIVTIILAGVATTGILRRTLVSSHSFDWSVASDEVAQAALPGRQKVVEHVAKYVKDVWHMEGQVPHHQLSEDFVKQLNKPSMS